MASPSVTYTFTNGTTSDGPQVSQNFTDLINSLTDGTKDLSISALTCAGTVSLNGNINLGNASGDTITVAGTYALSGTAGEASASNPGLMSTGTQTIAGAKTFSGQMTKSGITIIDAYDNSSRTVVTGSSDAEGQLTAATENLDQISEFSSNTFTAAVTGKYFSVCFVTFQYTTNPASTDSVILEIRHNTTPRGKVFSDETKTLGRHLIGTSALCSMTAGDTLKLYMTTNVGAGSRTLTTQYLSWIIFRVG